MDNGRALLIFLVVVGHFMEQGPAAGSDFWNGVYVAIYSFHMPAFMFLSGLFARSDAHRCAKSTVRMAVLYLTMMCFVWIASIAIGSIPKFNPFRPPYSTWYLLALTLMFLVLPVFSRVRFIVPLAFAFCVFAPCVKGFETFLTLGRFVYFLPFFLLGHIVGLNGVLSLRERIPNIGKIGIVAVAMLLIAVVVALNAMGYLPTDAVFSKESYAEAGFNNKWKAMLAKVFLIVTALSAIAALVVALPDKKLPVTYVGTNSLGVYMLQAVVMVLIPDKNPLDPFLFGWLSLPLSLIICLVFAAPPLSKILDWPAATLTKLLVPDKPKEV